MAMGIFLVLMCAMAQTWTQTSAPTNRSWLFISMSADGQKITAITSGAHPIYSTDFGNTWQTNQNAPMAYSCLAASADGTKLAMVDFQNFSIYVSTNSGDVWTQTSSPKSDQWWTLACSANGSTMIAAIRTSGSLIYVSTNSGLSWSPGGSPAKAWASVACSADGTKLVAAANGDKVYISTNSGILWTPTMAPTDNWSSLACNASGTHLIASGTATYLSTNFGSSWSIASTNTGPVASSADGKKLIIAGGIIYTSDDGGESWISNDAPHSWYCVSSSADGSEKVAARYSYPSSGIWIKHSNPSPQLNLTPANGSFALSWLIPSTNFVVQQSSDLADWETLTNPPALNFTNLQEELSLSSTNNSRFFRLLAQ